MTALNNLTWRISDKSYDERDEFCIGAWEADFTREDGSPWLAEFELTYNGSLGGIYTFYPKDEYGCLDYKKKLSSDDTKDWGAIDDVFPRFFWPPLAFAGRKFKERVVDENLHDILRECVWNELIEYMQDAVDTEDHDDIVLVKERLTEFNEVFNNSDF